VRLFEQIARGCLSLNGDTHSCFHRRICAALRCCETQFARPSLCWRHQTTITNTTPTRSNTPVFCTLRRCRHNRRQLQRTLLLQRRPLHNKTRSHRHTCCGLRSNTISIHRIQQIGICLSITKAAHHTRRCCCFAFRQNTGGRCHNIRRCTFNS